MNCLCTNLFCQTQAELNEESGKKYLKVDKELNDIYRNILKDYKDDTTFIKNLQISQRIWIQFRDAELKMKYPERELGVYGSIQILCESMYLTDLTQSRINSLKTWIVGVEEGDACSGSIKRKE